jgi:dihydrofolate reductase
MIVKLILAHDHDNAIGHEDGRLPWRSSTDMQRFKALTTGHTVIMGRKTFESLGRPNGLPNRINLVISRTSGGTGFSREETPNVYGFYDLETALDSSHFTCDPEVWIIGGATIYDYAIERQLVDEIHGTLMNVHSNAEVKIGYNLSDLREFIATQAELGVKWNLQTEIPSVLQAPDQAQVLLFYTLKKER